MTKESHDRNTAEGVGLDIQIGRPRAEPFEEPPVLARRKPHAEVPGVARTVVFEGSGHFGVVTGFTGRADPIDGRPGKEIYPGQQALTPELPLGLRANPR